MAASDSTRLPLCRFPNGNKVREVKRELEEVQEEEGEDLHRVVMEEDPPEAPLGVQATKKQDRYRESLNMEEDQLEAMVAHAQDAHVTEHCNASRLENLF